MSDRDRLTQRSIHFFNAWFVRLDQTGRTPLLTNRLWILAVSLILLILLVINLLLPLYPDLPWPETLYGLPVLSGTAAILLLLLLVYKCIVGASVRKLWKEQRLQIGIHFSKVACQSASPCNEIQPMTNFHFLAISLFFFQTTPLECS